MFLALKEWLEALQLAMNDAAGALNAWGDTLVSRLQDIFIHAREVALRSVRHEAAVALVIAQVYLGHILRSL